MMAFAAALALMLLIYAPAQAQIGVSIDAETMKLVSEMELTRMAVGGFALALIGFLILAWKMQKTEQEETRARAARENADRNERERFLNLLWAFQSTQQQTRDAILASNTGYEAQVDALKAHTNALNAETAEAKAFRGEISREMQTLRRAVTDGHDKMGKMMQDGIEAGMKAAASVFAEHNAAAITPLMQQIATLNERLQPQITQEKKEDEGISEKSGTAGTTAVDGAAVDGSGHPDADSAGQ